MNKELQKLLDTDIAFSKMSEENGATEAFVHYLTEDAIQLPNDRDPIIGRDNIYNSMKSPDTEVILTWYPEDGKVSNSGDLGYTWGKYTFILESGEEIKGKYLNVWVKADDGSWKVAVDMGNLSPKEE